MSPHTLRPRRVSTRRKTLFEPVPCITLNLLCRYYTDILQHMFSVVTDTSHTAGLTMHATILAYMFTLVESEKVKNPFQI